MAVRENSHRNGREEWGTPALERCPVHTRSSILRATATLTLVAGLVTSLVGCSAPAKSASPDCKPVASGPVSDAVKVSGDFGTKPTVTINFPVSAAATQRTVAIKGTGTTAVPGDTVNVDFALYNGTTGAAITATDYAKGSTTSFPLDEKQYLPGLVKTLECSAVGSRLVGVIPPADSFGDAGSDQLGVKPGQAIVFVVDVVSIAPHAAAALTKADGADQPPTPGFPTVVLAADGTPTITIPAATPPTDLKIALLKKGTGAVVANGDSVIVNYVGLNWNTNTVFDSSWARGKTATFNTGAVIAGFTKALVGQAIGSQVIAIIPPSEGYGAAGSPPNIGGTDTLVFVIDILGITAK